MLLRELCREDLRWIYFFALVALRRNGVEKASYNVQLALTLGCATPILTWRTNAFQHLRLAIEWRGWLFVFRSTQETCVCANLQRKT